jgi:hypothetical protein
MHKFFRIGLSLGFAAMADSSRALVFKFNAPAGMDTQAKNGFIAAGNRWSALFNDPIEVNINIDYQTLGAGVIGSTQSTLLIGSYSTYRGLMTSDKSTVADLTALANLPLGPALNAIVNRSDKNGNSATPYLDFFDGSNNNTAFVSTTAQAKALGATLPTGLPPQDARIIFSNSFTYDFNPGDGIAPGALDFVGMATHEIGHALGFISNVDIRDFYAQFGPVAEDTPGNEMMVMDFFRYSNTAALGVQRDWTVGSKSEYFSIDGGATPIAAFATGTFFGDGRQASHWKDGAGLGIMDPTAATGELLSISSNDILMLDVLGYNPVPEASTIWAGLTFAGLGFWQIRRRQRA